MTPTPASVQRKQGLAILKPVRWNQRRFTSPGPPEETLEREGGLFSTEVSQSEGTLHHQTGNLDK